MASKCKTSYSLKWEEDCSWLKKSKDVDCVHCKLSNKSFRIDGGGIAQVKSHQRSKSHKDRKQQWQHQSNDIYCSIKNREFITQNFCINSGSAVKAEILQALQYVECNYLFASAKKNSEIFKAMFPDSEIAKNYRQGETKVRYNIQFGIAPFIKDLLLKGFSDCPFSLKFDETATHKVLKQYNAYVQYWSKNYDCIVNSYCGSLLVTVPMKTLQNILNILMRTGNGIPHTYCNQELAFQRKLLKSLEEKSQTTFLDIGTCPLHIVHNAFEHGLKFLNFNAEQFIVDINSFFKLSSARREDFRALEEIAELPAHFTIKHSSTRWVNLKKMNNGKI